MREIEEQDKVVEELFERISEYLDENPLAEMQGEICTICCERLCYRMCCAYVVMCCVCTFCLCIRDVKRLKRRWT